MKGERLTFASTITAEGRRLKGSVKIAGQQTPRNGELVEVDLDALFRADRSEAVAVIGHQAFDAEAGYDPLRTVARLDNGSLRLTPTAEGFDYETDELPNTTYANDALELAAKGILGGTSFDIFGLRSTVRQIPGGPRVRRFTSISTFGAVTPVVSPAFPSSVAAFSKETAMADNESSEATATEEAPAKREPVTFTGGETAESPQTAKDEWAAFAKDLSTEQITGQMDAIFASAKGDLKGEVLDRYEGFAAELKRRKKADTSDRLRIERIEIEHNLLLGRVPKAPEAGLYESDDYKAAFGKYLRTGDKQIMAQFAQSIAGTGAEGGYAVPDGFLNRITESQKAYGGIAGVAETITTSDGESLRWPSNNDTANVAAIAAEGSAGAAGADLVLGSVTLGAFSYDANGAGNVPLKVSLELLQDAAFDIGAFVGRKLGERVGRKQAAHWATGAGTTEPFGLLSKTPDTMTATTCLAASIEHVFQVDAAYRTAGNCRWVMADASLVKFYGSVDGNGRPLLMPQATSGAGGAQGLVLGGYPITIDNGAGDLVAFGDIRQGYIIRYVRGVQVLVDPYTASGTRQMTYHAWARADANITDSAAYSVSDYSTVSADS